jgi:hypothetical protein
MIQTSETILKSRWWLVQLPPGWKASEDDTCVTLSGQHFSSALQLSAARKDTDVVTDIDLNVFAADRVRDKALLHVDTGVFSGFCAEQIEKGRFWREWWLRAGKLMVYVSYNIDAHLQESERSIIDSIIRSLRPIALE